MKNFYQTSNKALASIILGFVLCFTTSLNVTLAQVRVNNDGVAFSSATDHQSWATATSDLQAAINALSDAGGGTIWVAGGMYLPTELYSPAVGSSTTDARNATFVIRSNVTVIGGFAGDETSLDQRQEDKFSTTNTVYLSGNIDLSDNNENNSYHVVVFPSGVNETAILQDLVISNGNANGPSEDFAHRGGGVHAREGGVLRNCIITNNFADTGGGGAYLYRGGQIEDCAIYDNTTNQLGGGVVLNRGGTIKTSLIYSNNAGPASESNGFGGGIFLEADADNPVTVSHSIIAGNYSNNKGGGIGLLYGGHLINNVIANNESGGNGGGAYLQEGGTMDYNTIVANKSGVLGGGVYGNQNAELHNSVLWGNVSTSLVNQQFDRADESTTASYCAIQGMEEATGLTNIINLDPENSGEGTHPEFWNPVTFEGIPADLDQIEEMRDSDYRIFLASALLNAGNSESSGLPIPQSDLTPNARIVKGTVDIGAFEALYYNLNASVTTGGGTINPSDSVDYLAGENILFTITPETDMDVLSFMINSEDYTDQLTEEEGQFTYTVAGISQDLEVTVEFGVASTYYNINTSVTSGSGTIDPLGSHDYLAGEDILFTITPETDMDVLSFMINGDDYTDQLAEEEGQFTYTFADISQNLDVTVEFGVASGLENNPEEKMIVYPVPAGDALFLQGVNARTLKIYDANGKIVKELKENIGYSINVSGLKKGIYILIIEDENDESHSARFIKK